MNRAEQSPTLIYGGAFDPPTSAHQAIMSECLKLPDFDEVWLMPCGGRMDKSISTTDDERLAMLRLMKNEVFPDEPRLKIVEFELFGERPITTYSTVGRLALAYPDKNMWYAFGSDSYTSMPSWPHGQELQATINAVVFNRNGDHIQEHKNLKVVKLKGCDNVSSTLVREKARQNEDIATYVCGSVAEYIKQHRLYSRS